jgi:hypothetical protein
MALPTPKEFGLILGLEPGLHGKRADLLKFSELDDDIAAQVSSVVSLNRVRGS